MKKGKVALRKRASVTTGKEGKIVPVRRREITTSTGRVVTSGNEVDIVFVFDTTGSMDDEIDGLLTTCSGFVGEANKLDLNPQFALIAFGDISVFGGGDTIELVVPLTESVEKMKYGLAHIPRNNGFGNEGETCLEAIYGEAFNIKHRKGSVKVLILITDEPALEYRHKIEDTIRELSQREYLVFVISTDKPYYKEMALRNGGIWKEIGSNTSLEEILSMFKEMARKVSEVAQEVYLLGDGSVKEYLRLKAPKDN